MDEPRTTVLETDRLILRRFILEDAALHLELLNDADFLRYIGDRGVRTLEEAQESLRTGPLASYQRFGFGPYRVERKADGIAIGLCGLINREALEDVDVGYAFLPRYRGQGYAYEAAAAVLAYGRTTFGLDRIVAIVSPDNAPSIRLLEKLGMHCERKIRLSPDDEEILLFVTGAREAR